MLLAAHMGDLGTKVCGGDADAGKRCLSCFHPGKDMSCPLLTASLITDRCLSRLRSWLISLQSSVTLSGTVERVLLSQHGETILTSVVQNGLTGTAIYFLSVILIAATVDCLKT